MHHATMESTVLCTRCWANRFWMNKNPDSSDSDNRTKPPRTARKTALSKVSMGGNAASRPSGRRWRSRALWAAKSRTRMAATESKPAASADNKMCATSSGPGAACSAEAPREAVPVASTAALNHKATAAPPNWLRAAPSNAAAATTAPTSEAASARVSTKACPLLPRAGAKMNTWTTSASAPTLLAAFVSQCCPRMTPANAKPAAARYRRVAR